MRPRSRNLFSIERVFEVVRSAMPADENLEISEWSAPDAQGFVGMVRAAWAARQAQGDINHVTGDAHYLTWFLDRSRTVLTVHDLRHFHRLKGLRKWVYWLLWFKIPFARCACITAISESTRKELLTLAPNIADRLVVIVNPQSRDFDAAQADEPIAGQSKPLKLLHIGTAPPKNLQRHLDAIADLDAILAIVGPVTPQVQAEIESHCAQAVVLGAVSDNQLSALYRESDLLLFASLSEGFGLPILEAQAAGLPVIAGNNTSMPDTAGGGALLVDAENTSEIRAAIVKLANDPSLRHSMIGKGRENLKRFAPDVVARHYAQVYRELYPDAS
jgi:glycosyltransferase involved in cell wall biosynthesis